LAPNTPLRHRALVAFDVTDEIFGISVAVEGTINPYYNYGAMTVAIPGWSLGAALGVLSGNILPNNLVSALGVGLYGMFLAIVIPPARKSKIIAGIVIISMFLSFALTKIPLLNGMSSGLRVIVLTVIIALAAAILFPVKEDENAK
jgi:predicted branched-subunit amino acid permease